MAQSPRMPDRGETLRRLAPLFGLGVQFAVTILLGVGAGYLIDNRYDCDPWAKLIGGIVGIGIGFCQFFRAVLPRESDRKDRPGNES